MSDNTEMAALLARAEAILAQRRTVAVVGVSSDPHKYGREVFDVLRPLHTVLPVNPRLAEVDGTPCYPSAEALAQPVDVVVFAVNPELTERMVPAWLGRAPVLWLPPGCFTERAAALAREGGAEVIVDLCPVFVTRRLAARRG